MIAALDRHIRENCHFSILKDMEFEGSRKVLNGKAIHLQQKGKGKRPNKADLITAEEEALLWESVLGQENPTSLFSSFLTNILAPGEDKSTTNCELKI